MVLFRPLEAWASSIVGAVGVRQDGALPSLAPAVLCWVSAADRVG